MARVPHTAVILDLKKKNLAKDKLDESVAFLANVNKDGTTIGTAMTLMKKIIFFSTCYGIRGLYIVAGEFYKNQRLVQRK